MRNHRRWALAAALTCVGLVWPSGRTLAADIHHYAGYTTGTEAGVDGYIRQSTTTPLPAGRVTHADWISICGTNCSTMIWAQMGAYQGTSGAGISLSAVDMYWENYDACGDYYTLDFGPVPLAAADQPYNIKWDGGSSQRIACSNGDHLLEYYMDFRNGSVTSTPVGSALMPNWYGDAEALTEQINGATIGTDYYGCNPSKNCSNGSYGIHVFDGTNWGLWTGASTPKHDNPPYLKGFQSYWAWASCPVSC